MKYLTLLLLFGFLTISLLPSTSSTSSIEPTVLLDPLYGTDSNGQEFRLTYENLSERDFPKPIHSNPILFVHGYDYKTAGQEGEIKGTVKGEIKSYARDWQQHLAELPSFREALLLPENARLNIEPYYIDLETETVAMDGNTNRPVDIQLDAAKIKEAVELILIHQGDPAAKKTKVTIIAFGTGALSTRWYLNELWESQNKSLSFHPVSEFIAISPPNHGMEQPLPVLEPGIIERLNGHPLSDSMKDNFCGYLFDSEAPGSRKSNEPVAKGILYVTVYADGNDSMAGGSEPGENSGSALAANMSPLAINLEIPGIPGGSDKQRVHLNTPHMPEVIGKALYTSVYHQPPPVETVFQYPGADNERQLVSPPVIPPHQQGIRQAGIVLLLDISTAMPGDPLNPAEGRAEAFLKLLEHLGQGKTNLGMAVFPTLPWNRFNPSEGQVIHPMTPVTGENVKRASGILNCSRFRSQGKPSFLKAVNTGLELFSNEKNKTMIVFSNAGRSSDCFTAANMNDAAVKEFQKKLSDKNVTLYTYGCGGFGKLIAAGDEFSPAIVADLLNLEKEMDINGVIEGGGTIESELIVNPQDISISFFLGWDTGKKDLLSIAITTSDGEEIPANSDTIRMDRGETYTILTVSQSFLKQMGKAGTEPWKIKIMGSQIPTGDYENYSFFVVKDSPVKMKTTFDKPAYQCGDTITVTAAVSRDGNRLKDLPQVSAVVTAPAEGMGNWHATHKVDRKKLDKIGLEPGNKNTSLLDLKIMYLTRTRGVPLPAQREPVTVILSDNGTDGDKVKGDGIYTGQFKNTDKNGKYTFVFEVTGDNFQRRKHNVTYVKSEPDPVQSSVELLPRDMSEGNHDDRGYDVRVTPKDRFGNFMGPGHRVQVRPVQRKKDLETITLEDRLDGSYTGSIRVPRRVVDSGADLSVSVDGTAGIMSQKIPAFKKWSAGVYAGFTTPASSTFSDTHNASFSIGGTMIYQFASQFSVTGTLGCNRFGSAIPNTDNLTWWHISCNLRSEIMRRPFGIYINAGPGIYMTGGGTVDEGFNCGAGMSYDLSRRKTLELGTDFHWVFTDGFDTNFFTTYARIIFRF